MPSSSMLFLGIQVSFGAFPLPHSLVFYFSSSWICKVVNPLPHSCTFRRLLEYEDS